MTRPKKAERPKCKLIVFQPREGKPIVEIAWLDQGKERVSARITKALKAEGYESQAGHSSRYAPEGYRHCGIRTPAPVELVQNIVQQHFLVVDVERHTEEEEPESHGTALDLI